MPLLTPGASRFKPVGLLKMGPFSTVSLVLEQATGTTWVARWFNLPEGVAEVELLEAIDREARALKSLPKLNVPCFERVVEGEGGTWMLFEWVQGKPLSHYLSVENCVSPPWIVWWLYQLLTTLHQLHTHSEPFVIGYLEPSDLLVVQDRLVVADLGIFEDLCPGAGASLLHRSLYANFVAPEKRTAVLTLPASDLFSAAAITFWLWTGSAPVCSGPAAQPHLLAALRQFRPGLPEEVSQLVSEMLDYDPAGRPDSAQVALDRLRPFVTSMRRETPPVPPEHETYKYAAEATRIDKPPTPIFDAAANQADKAAPPASVAVTAVPSGRWQDTLEDAAGHARRHPAGAAIATLAVAVLLFCGARWSISAGGRKSAHQASWQVTTGQVLARGGPGALPWNAVTQVEPGALVSIGNGGATMTLKDASMSFQGGAAVHVDDTDTSPHLHLLRGWLRATTGHQTCCVAAAEATVTADPSSELSIGLEHGSVQVSLQSGTARVVGRNGTQTLTPGSTTTL